MHEQITNHLNHPCSTGAILAVLMVFLASYALIISEKIHRTTIAIFGGAIMVVLGIFLNIYNQESAISAVDFNTIGLLVGMMIIVTIVKDTGLFQYIAILAAKVARGNPWKIMAMFAVITAVFSALLDNVTTVLLMVPMTLVICDNLKIDPKPFLFMEILMSNIGGTATLIGDPPNILIGSAANLSFMDFVINLSPVVLVISIVIIYFIKTIYKKQLKATPEDMEKIAKFDEKNSITNKTLLIKSLFVLILVMIGFFIHGIIHVDGATIALLGAGLLLFLENKNPEKVLHGVEWTMIFFFIGLFVLVGGLEHAGIINMAAEKLLSLTDNNLAITSLSILWSSAIFSAFVDNIPFVATMIPLVEQMGEVFTDLNPIWWSLALGACLGGNGTLVGASANLVVVGLAEKSGYKIKFVEFMKIGLMVMFISISISTFYVFWRFL